MSVTCTRYLPAGYVCVRVGARAQWVREVRPDPSLEDGCCVKSCGCRGQEEIGVSLCSLLFFPVIVFFFPPSSHVLDFSHSRTYSLLRFFWTKSCKIWSTFDGIANENQNPSLDLNFSEHECLVALSWFGCCCCCFLWGPSVLLFRKEKIFQLTYTYIYRFIGGLRMGENLEASGAEYEDKAEKKLKSWGILGGKYEDAADLLEKAGNSFKLAKSCKKNPCLLHFSCLFCIRKCFLAIFDNRNSRNDCRSRNFSKFLAILDNRNSRSVCCSENFLKFLANFENRICLKLFAARNSLRFLAIFENRTLETVYCSKLFGTSCDLWQQNSRNCLLLEILWDFLRALKT